MWQGTVDFLKAHPDIKLGDQLTAQQRASLTEPILWYTTQNINGQTVLVPQLLLPESRLAEWTKTNGGSLVANDIYLAGSTVYNSGAILATNTLSITTDTFTNERRVATLIDRSDLHVELIQSGGILTGNVVQIITTGNLVNIGGTIIADRALNLVAGGDLVLTSAVANNSYQDGSKSHSVDMSSTTNYGGTIYSGGDATLFAGHDLKIAGSSVIALGSVSLLAGNDLSITSVTDASHLSESRSSSSAWRTKTTTTTNDSTTEVSSNIVAGGRLVVAAAGNVDIHASNLIAGDDMLVAAGAGANGRRDASVTITAGQNTTSSSYNQTRSGYGVGSGDGWVNIKGRKSTSSETDTVTNVASTLAAGGNLTIMATQDIAIQGSVISAGDTAGLLAGRDILVTPGMDGMDSSVKKVVSGEGFGDRSSDGTAKAQAGYRRDKEEYTLETTTVVPSLIQGGAGVVMNAGNDITLQAARIASPGDITLFAGHDVNMTAGYDTSSQTAKTDHLFIGVTAQASQNVTGIISDMKKAADIFNSGHGSTAYEAVGVISGVMKGMDALSAAASGPRVSASITVGADGTKRSSYETSLMARGTELDAGGNLTIAAGNDIRMAGVQGHTGGDINLIAGHDLIIESAQSYAASGSKEQSWNVGIGFGASAGMGGAAAGIQIEGGFSRSENEGTATQQVNTHLFAGGNVNMLSGNDTTIAGAVIHGAEVNLDVGNNLTIQSRQDIGHTEGSAIRGGGSATFGAGAAFSAYGGGGSSDSDVAWVREQTGVYSDGKLNIRTENHTQVDGAVINSSNGDLTLDTGTLGFSTIKDHDTGSSFDMTLGYSGGTQKDTPYPWLDAGGSAATRGGGNPNPVDNNRTVLPPGPSVGGSIEEHDRQQDTNATIGAGTITIRNQDAQKQDVAALNRDVSQAQVLTKDESSGVNFYASSQAINGLADPKQFSQQTLAGFERQFDQLAAMGNDSAAQLREAVRNGTFTEETVRALQACSNGGGQQGWNILDLFVTKAHAAGTCLVPIGGKLVPIAAKDVDDCARIGIEMLNAERGKFYDARVELMKNPDPEFGYSTRDMANDNYQGQVQIRGQGGLTVQYVDENGVRSPVLINYQGSQQYIFANPVTGGPELYNPIRPAQDLPARPGTISPSNHGGYEGFPSSGDFVDHVTVISPMITQMQGHTFGIAVEGASLLIMVGGALKSAVTTSSFSVETLSANTIRGSGTYVVSGESVSGAGASGVVTAQAGAVESRGLSGFGGIFLSETNEAGGQVWTSTGMIAQKDFTSIVNSSLMRGKNGTIISGVHGSVDGTIAKVDASMFLDDVRRFGEIPGVRVLNYTDMTSNQMNQVLNSNGVTIGGFCFSAACLAKFR